MKTNQERARIRAARYMPSRRFEEGLEMTLRHLPARRRQRTAWEKSAIALASAAALVLFCVFAAPPIVRAAGALIERVFGAWLAQIDEYAARSEEEKFKDQLAEGESYSRGHRLNATTTFEGVDITLTHVRMRAIDPYEYRDAMAEVDLSLIYSALPSFDPNFIDFTLTYGGVEWKQDLGDGIPHLRRSGVRAQSEDDWYEGPFNDYSDSQVVDGVPQTYVRIQVDDWLLADKTPMILRGTLDGKSFEIPFVFDPVLAHEWAVTQATDNVIRSDRIMQERKAELADMAENAVAVGLTGSIEGIDYMLSELVIRDGMLTLTGSVAGFERTDWRQLPMIVRSFGEIYTDGYPVARVSCSYDQTDDGLILFSESASLSRDTTQLPEESLITYSLTLRKGDTEYPAPMAFRYNWREQKVTLPRDEAQMQDWLVEGEALKEALLTSAPYQTIYDLHPLNLTQNISGLSVTLTEVTLTDDSIDFNYKLATDDKAHRNGRVLCHHFWEEEDDSERIEEAQATLNGQAAQGTSTTFSERDIPTASSFNSSLHRSQIGDATQVTFTLPIQIMNRKDEVIYRETFYFEFTIDRDSLEHVDKTYEELMKEWGIEP